MKTFSYYFFTVLVILLSAIYLPLFYEKIFFTSVERTHLFYSPVTEDFILTEKILGPLPKAMHDKAEDHHAAIAYQNADGTYVSRVEFEKSLPFIYYRNRDSVSSIFTLPGDKPRSDTVETKKSTKLSWIN